MSRISRRSFMKSAVLASASFGVSRALVFPAPGYARELNVNSKLNLAHVGLGGMQVDFHRSSCAQENRVAICDVDESFLVK